MSPRERETSNRKALPSAARHLYIPLERRFDPTNMEDTSTFLYSAYGSNMSCRRLNHPNRAPSAMPVGAATAHGYRLVFDKVSTDGSGKADCEHTGDPDHRVFGGLFRIPKAELGPLDRVEGATGANAGYRRIVIEVTTEHGPVKAVTYVACQKMAGLKPYTWYRRHVIVGAKEFNLPPAYIQALESLDAQEDPDKDREARELAIYQGDSATP